MDIDKGSPISYKVLAKGTVVFSADGEIVGRVIEALDNPDEDIFDGITIDTDHGKRFVDAPEVAACYENAVELTLNADQIAALPTGERGAGFFTADPNVETRSGGLLDRVRSYFGRGGWKQ